MGWIGGYLAPAKNGPNRPTVALMVEALGEELSRRGYRIDAAREAWTEDKLITIDPGDPAGRRLIRRWVGGTRVHVFEFDRAQFDGEPDPEPETEPDPATDSAPADCPECNWPTDSAGHEAACG
jgi:hypothetical protein